MRKADKRRQGAERAEAYLREERERGLAAQRLANRIRAEKAQERADENEHKARRRQHRTAVAQIGSLARGIEAHRGDLQVTGETYLNDHVQKEADKQAWYPSSALDAVGESNIDDGIDLTRKNSGPSIEEQADMAAANAGELL